MLTVAALLDEPSVFRAHRLKGVLHVLDRGAPEIRAGGGQGFDKAAADAFVGATGVVRAIGVRLEPDREQVEVGRCVGVELGQTFGTRARDLRLDWRDDFELGVGQGTNAALTKS